MILACGAMEQIPFQDFSDAIAFSSRKLSAEEQKFYDLACDEEYKAASVDSSFNVGNKKLNSNNWMEGLDGNKKLNQLNIPGSHDSLAYEMSDFVKKYAQCQDDTLREQLENGIRIFDVRLFYDSEKDDIFCCHGKGLLQCNCHKKNNELISYVFVLSTVANFLRDHPSETVIIAPKHESGNKKLTNHYINLCHAKLKKLGILYIEDRVPKLNEVRGKIVLWDKKDILDGGMKILTTNAPFSDEKYAGVGWHIQKKFNTNPKEKVGILKEFFEKVEKENYQDPNYGYINYASGFYLHPLPDSVSVSQEVNTLIVNHNFKKGFLYGWIIGDFVNLDYAKAIYLSNF